MVPGGAAAFRWRGRPAGATSAGLGSEAMTEDELIEASGSHASRLAEACGDRHDSPAGAPNVADGRKPGRFATVNADGLRQWRL